MKVNEISFLKVLFSVKIYFGGFFRTTKTRRTQRDTKGLLAVVYFFNLEYSGFFLCSFVPFVSWWFKIN